MDYTLGTMDTICAKRVIHNETTKNTCPKTHTNYVKTQQPIARFEPKLALMGLSVFQKGTNNI